MIHSYERVDRLVRSGASKLSFSKVFSLAIALLISLGAFAQDVVTGKVTDAADGSGVPGVSIAVKGTTKGTQTDVNGTYKVNAAKGATLVFSFVGYLKKEVVVNASTLNVSLTVDNKALEEVVVVGYGTVKKKDLTGAVTTIGTKDFQKGIVTSPEQLLQGRVAGVQITQSSGEPGGGINVRIRGTSSVYGGNQPLFVIDGVPLSSDATAGGVSGTSLGSQPPKNPLNFLNPNDIQSIDILKDASATAIYGSRGANGVVIVTTKKGTGKGSLNYDVSFGISNITKKYDLLSAEEYAKVALPAQNLGSKTDWQNELFRSAITKQHNLSYGGGDATGNYRVSYGILDQEGIIKRSSVKRNNLTFSGGKKFFGDRLNLNSNLTVSSSEDSGLPNGQNSGFEGDLLGGVLKSNPTMPVRNSNGTFYQYSTAELNPIALLNLSKDNTSTLRALGNFNAELQLAKGLKFKTVVGFDQSMSTRKAAFSRDLVVSGIKDLGRASISDIFTNNQLWENYFTYDKDFSGITLNAMAGYSYQSFAYEGKNIQATNFRTNDLDIMLNNMASTQFGPGKVGAFVSNSFGTKDELQSYFGRANVSVNDKYLLTATLRVDGSSKFGGSNKYGYFPSFAAKWKLLKEDFMPKDIFDDLALRVGYGVTGNQNIPHNLYDQRDRYSDWGTNNDAQEITGGGLNPVTFSNPNLKWETTASTNFGIDFAILKNRLSGSIEYYQKNTKDLLFQVISAQPAPTPFAWKNLDTDIENRGIEVNLTGIIVDNANFTWEALLNVAQNSNMVKNLGGVYDTGEISGQGLTGAFAQRIAAGQPLFSFFLREFGGFDATGNSIYPAGDFQKFVGMSALPTLTGGLTNNFKYKNFDLSLFFNGVFGNYIYSNTANAYFTKGALNNGRNVTRNVVGLNEGAYNAPEVSTRFVEKGDFVRLQNLTLGYKVPTKGKVLSGLRVFVSGQNVLTFTNYSGQDPEVSTNKSINGISSAGIDYQAYPRATTWTVGANFSF
jgi:TonB-linked SusC/RagA family outer membrane protein